MAHNYSNFLSRDTEYHPLGNVRSPIRDVGTVPLGVLHDSRDASFDTTSYPGRDITDQHHPDDVPSDTRSRYQAPHLHDFEAQKGFPTEVVTNVPAEQLRFRFRDWQWEFGACAFSVGCLATIVGVLAAYQHRSLASWTFVLGISVNTLIAILSTFSRTALMVPVASCISQLKWIHLVGGSRSLQEMQVFEDASRGPWGSLELIWRLHLKSKLATWGALITILTLAMDPFAQQLVSYPSREVLIGDATFYTSHIYDSSYGEPRQLRAASGRITSTMGPKMQGAVLNGLYNLTTAVQFACPTGNCRWDDFSSLAVTSTCTNVTSLTKTLCERSGSSYYCNYTTPAGFFITSTRSSRSGGGSSTSFNATAFKPTSYSYGPVDDRSSPVNSTIARIAMANLDGDFNMDRPDVSECDMRLMARVTRNLTVTNGTFHPGLFEDIELEGVPGKFDDEHKTSGVKLRDWYTFNITGDHPSYPGNRSFSYNTIDLEGAKNLLYNIFTADSGSASGGSQVNPYYWPLMNSTDQAGVVASIAQSMTYAFAHAPSGETLKGRALSSELYISVHWLWIILPLTEVVMGLTFLLCTLIHTQRNGVTAWKSCGIVPLLTVMVGWENSQLGAGSWKEIDDKSKHMRGQLVVNDGQVLGFHRTK
ncbi:hypothetical protein E8E13_010919 [Curvularia kusanoi]|uniref:Uncharacterized protein n=1 Tax=Curvularia kusanoi TaxID=90978 RepID=A0A9P4THZ9_CURKU|nr:hypothetical protein E8E13_010919 [Curvularia kusanoi]